MPKKQDGDDPSSDKTELESTPQNREAVETMTISVTIPTAADEELDDDDVILDDVAIDPAATVLPASPVTEPAPAPRPPKPVSTSAAKKKTTPRTAKKSSKADESGEAKDTTTPSAGSASATPRQKTAQAADRPARSTSKKAAETGSAGAESSADAAVGAAIETSGAARDRQAEGADDAASGAGAQAAASLSARSIPSSRVESSGMLTDDRMLEPKAAPKESPSGGWQRAVYAATGGLLNVGDGRSARERKELRHRIAKPFVGSARFVPVLSRKGGVGKTTVAVLLGMALADARDDRVIALDANPDRGTLADRVSRTHDHTVRDAIRRKDEIAGYTDFSALVVRDATRLDVLASDGDPLAVDAFDADDYTVAAELAGRYYSIVLTDSGTGIVHEASRATIERADGVVIVSGGGLDGARLASETLSWLEANDHGALARSAVVVLNSTLPVGTGVKLDELEAHFRSRTRGVVRIPFDPALKSGSVIDFGRLRPATRRAARELAALVVDGLPTQRPAV